MEFKNILSADYCGIDAFLEQVILPVMQCDIDRKDINLLKNSEMQAKAAHANIIAIKNVGTLDWVGSNNIEVYDVTLSDSSKISRSKVNIQNIIKSELFPFTHAFIVFHYEHVEKRSWRFSYCYKQNTIANSTSAKRFTYLFGRDFSCKTADMRFHRLMKSSRSDKDLEDAFSVQALSDEFFYKYLGFYSVFVEYITGVRQEKAGIKNAEVKEIIKWFEKSPCYADRGNQYEAFNKDTKTVRNYVKKMMGRIVFLYFLQHKGWLAKDYNYMSNLLNNSSDEQKNDFLDKCLEPMFFGLLNTKPDDRKNISFNGVSPSSLPLANDIPYLNGGLFQQEAIDKVNSDFPYEMFKALFDFFDSYNFTIAENEPDDAEIGVDPEMLSRIFENLLEDNNDKGAFYTPKEIVQYMCRESLIAYLDGKIADKTEDLRSLVITHKLPDTLLSVSEKLNVLLKDVKICDPAIGSGAFPMGMLNELVACRLAIYPEQDKCKLKKDIIKNNIYGVDIEQGAIDIARLRFWLSILVDSQEAEPLPNFDYKFMLGNSLLESYAGFDLSKLTQIDGSVATPEPVRDMFGYISPKNRQTSIVFTEKKINEKLNEKLKQYFDVSDHAVREILRTEIKGLVRNLIVSNIDKRIKSTEENIEQIQSNLKADGKSRLKQQKQLEALQTELQHYHDIHAQVNAIPMVNDAFFLWHTWFADVFEEGGFDIVIGNPPYIQLQNNGGELAKLYESGEFKTFTRTGDIYCLFYELGWRVLAKRGHLCYITSNKWMRAGYGEKTREFFAKNTNPVQLIDFAGVGIFENATVDTNILMFAKEENQHNTLCAVTKGQSKDCIKNLSLFVHNNHTNCDFSTSDSWVILSPIEQSIKRKIEAVGTPLKDWDIQINYGIKTGCNEAFIIKKDVRDQILANCQTEDERKRTDELIRPILRGRDIKRYGYDWADLWLINTHNGIKGVLPRIDINDYPAVKQHLDKYWNKIEKRADQGDTPYNLRNCAYMEDFNKPKIIWKRIGSILRFSYDVNGCFGLDSTCFATGTHIEYLCCVLNSLMGHYLLKDSPKTGTGDLLISVQAIEPICIPYIANLEKRLIKLLESHTIRNEEINNKEINDIVFSMYGLSPIEREYITLSQQNQ